MFVGDGVGAVAQPVWILILIDGGETQATVGSNNVYIVYHLYIHIPH